MAKYDKNSVIKGMVSIANPFDVYLAAANANKLQNHVYGRFLTQKLTEKVLFNKKMIDEWCFLNNVQIDYEKLKKTKTTFDFDQEFTFKVIDSHNNSKEYYRTFSCVDEIAHVEKPVLFLHSKNDPISSIDLIPIDVIKKNKNFFLAITPKGGHVEFLVDLGAKRVF